MDLIDKLRTRRINSGISQRELAEHLGVTKLTVLNWENKRKKMYVPTYEKIVKYLDEKEK